MRLRQVIDCLGECRVVSGPHDFEIAGVSCNSKAVAPGFVFVAVKGAGCDGHAFIAEALTAGARAVVYEDALRRTELDALIGRSRESVTFLGCRDTRKAAGRIAAAFYQNPGARLKAIGVTGTNGKTTITYLIEALVRQAGLVPGVIGTVNYRFREHVCASKNTTPGPVELQGILADMCAAGVTHCAMEVSSHALHQDRTEGIAFSSAVFTNLTQDHLDYHISMENYFQAKCKLFRTLPPHAYAIVNNDDLYGRMLRELTPARVITYGIENASKVEATDIRFDVSGTRFVLRSFAGTMELRTRLIGLHNVYNILAAVSWALAEGLPLGVISAALEGFSCAPGRLERVGGPGGPAVFVDYAHTDDALKNVIATVRALSPRRIIVVFGCGGDRDKHKRPKMGQVVAARADYAVITSDNPRSEDPERIIADITQGITTGNYRVVIDRREAIRQAIAEAGERDIVIVAGKGHETVQITKDTTTHFDDREVVRQCFGTLHHAGSKDKIHV